MRAATVSLVVAIILLAAKLIAWRMTGSAAILSDALESIVNVVAAGMALFSVWYGSPQNARTVQNGSFTARRHTRADCGKRDHCGYLSDLVKAKSAV